MESLGAKTRRTRKVKIGMKTGSLLRKEPAAGVLFMGLYRKAYKYQEAPCSPGNQAKDRNENGPKIGAKSSQESERNKAKDRNENEPKIGTPLTKQTDSRVSKMQRTGLSIHSCFMAADFLSRNAASMIQHQNKSSITDGKLFCNE